jgi:hypothetical protein
MGYGGRIRFAGLLAGVASASAILAGCGGKDFADRPRPAAPVELTGVITDAGVTVSPNRVGAGPVVIIVSNQTQASHTLTLDGRNIGAVSTAPISPSDTGRIQRTLDPGTYTVKAGSQQAVTKPIRPARVVIGKPRPDSNDQVGLP